MTDSKATGICCNPFTQRTILVICAKEWLVCVRITFNSLACVAADSFPFSGGVEIEQANEKRASEGARLG